MRKATTATIVFLILLVACATGFLLAVRDVTIVAPPEMELNIPTKVAEPEGFRNDLVARLAYEPLNQAVFNLYYVAELKRAPSEERRAQLVDTLARLGWRNTSAQRNLILEAVRTGDLDLALLRADGMLRREKMTEFLLPVMRQMELDQTSAVLLAQRLERNPDWRADYFANVDNLADDETRAARIALFRRMVSAKMPVYRSELQPSMSKIVSGGGAAQAVEVAALFGIVPAPGGLNHDPQFVRTARLAADDWRTPLPFEWDLANRRGVKTESFADERGAGLELDWDGRGAPELLRQLVYLGQSTRPRLEVELADKRSSDALQKLRFGWKCINDKIVIPFDAAAPGAPGPVQFILEQPSACDFGYLEVLGRPQINDAEVEVTFRRIAVLP